MERLVRKEFILAVGICLIAVLIAGCEEQNLSTTRESKLIAYENRQLKKQLAQQEKKIEEQSRLLEESRRREKIPEGRFREELDAQVSEVMGILGQANRELHRENNELKAQVEELQGRVRELEQELKRFKPPAEPQPLTP
jgi:hypothetical protein